MGTDIHPIVQVRTAEGWQYVGQGPKYDEKYGDGGNKWTILTDRHYDLFSILAGVRNGTAFAGCVTGTPIIPISEPRGLPDDLTGVPISPLYVEHPEWFEKGEDTRFYFGDHSFSWVTLTEIEKFPWTEPRGKVGVISAESYDTWLEGNEDRSKPPGAYSGWISGREIATLTEKEFLSARQEGTLQKSALDAYLRELQQNRVFMAGLGFSATRLLKNEEIILPDSFKIYVQVTWMQTHKQTCDGFYNYVIPWLQQLADDNHVSHDDVRIVFGFDS